MSDFSSITAAGRAIAAFKSTQALSRGGERAARRPNVQPTEAAGTQPDRTLNPIKTGAAEPTDERAVKSVQVGDRRLAARGSIVDIFV